MAVVIFAAGTFETAVTQHLVALAAIVAAVAAVKIQDLVNS